MFRPNTHCLLAKKLAKRTATGKTQYGPFQSIGCAIVSVEPSVVQSSVRADSSASQSAAHEYVVDAVVLIPKTVVIAEDDVVQLFPGKPYEKHLRVVAVQPRINVLGHLDHFEVGLMVRADG